MGVPFDVWHLWTMMVAPHEEWGELDSGLQWQTGQRMRTLWWLYLCHRHDGNGNTMYMFLEMHVLKVFSFHLGVCQRTKCIPGIPEGSWENRRGSWPGWMAAHRGRWEMASCERNRLKGSIDRLIIGAEGRYISLVTQRQLQPRFQGVSVLVCCRTAPWRSQTERSTFSSWHKENTSLPRE